MISVVIPTLGRPSLARTIYSFIEQLEPGDEVLLVADPKGDVDYVRFLHRNVVSKALGVESRVLVQGGPEAWGHPQRNKGLTFAFGGRVWCLADDDVATPTALASIRLSIEEGDPWTIFTVGRTDDTPWVWADPTVRVGNLDADCLVVPGDVEARWHESYTGDLVFAEALVEELGPPVFRQDVIAVTTPSLGYLEKHYAGLVNGW